MGFFRTANTEEVVNDSSFIEGIETLQERVAVLPDYGFESKEVSETIGTTTSGIVGSLITLLITFGLGLIIRRRGRKEKQYE